MHTLCTTSTPNATIYVCKHNVCFRVFRQGFASIESDLMSLLHLSPRSIFNIGAGDGTYTEVESVLDETRRYTR